MRRPGNQANWFGVTYPDDKAFVQDNIGNLIERGEYPARL